MYDVNIAEKFTLSTSNYHHGDLRAALLEAALAEVRERGPAALGLRAVARRVGVSPMAPYRHFTDKEALLADVAAQGFWLFKRRLEDAAGAQAEANAALIAQGVAYVRFANDEPSLFRLMFGPLIADQKGHPALLTAGEAARSVLAAAVAAATPAMAPAERADFALACWATAHGLASLLVDGAACQGLGMAAIEQQARRALAFLVQG